HGLDAGHAARAGTGRAGHALEDRFARAGGVDARAGAGPPQAGDVVGGAFAVVVGVVAALDRLLDRADAGLEPADALVRAGLAVRAAARVLAVGQVARRAARGVEPRVGEVIVDGAVAVLVAPVAHLGDRHHLAAAGAEAGGLRAGGGVAGLRADAAG